MLKDKQKEWYLVARRKKLLQGNKGIIESLMPGGGQERASDPLELYLGAVYELPDISAGNQTWILCKSCNALLRTEPFLWPPNKVFKRWME